MAIQKQIWISDIARNVYRNNKWVTESRKDDAYVDNKTVNLPQSGAKPNVVKNRTVIPASASKRIDSVKTYDIDEFTTDPTVIQDIEEVETSYDKRGNVLRDHQMELDAWIARNILYNWAPTNADRILPTTGAAGAGVAFGAAGDRKRVTRQDILALNARLDDDDVPSEGRVLLLDSTNKNNLLLDDKITSKDFMPDYSQKTGFIGTLYGFKIYVRSKTGSFRAGVAVDPFAVPDVADNSFCLAWHPDFVRRALGSVKVFSRLDDPLSYGSMFSTLVRQGGTTAYSSELGVAALVEATV